MLCGGPGERGGEGGEGIVLVLSIKVFRLNPVEGVADSLPVEGVGARMTCICCCFLLFPPELLLAVGVLVPSRPSLPEWAVAET